MSGGYSSKLDESIALLICGMMGGVSVRLRSPSQLNPSNHLRINQTRKRNIEKEASQRMKSPLNQTGQSSTTYGQSRLIERKQKNLFTHRSINLNPPLLPKKIFKFPAKYSSIICNRWNVLVFLNVADLAFLITQSLGRIIAEKKNNSI
jgi:hypothetical protein